MPAPQDDQLRAPNRPVSDRGQIRFRVRYHECDPGGVAHHASYLPWFEMARTEILRECGVSYADMERAGVYLVITRMDVRYRRPAKYDQELLLNVRVAGGGRARIDHEYELFGLSPGGSAGELLSTAASTLACVGRDGRPRPLPDWLYPGAHVPPGVIAD